MRIRRNGHKLSGFKLYQKITSRFHNLQQAAWSWRKGLIRTSSKTRLKVHAQYLCETWFKLFHPKLSKVFVTCAQGFWKPEWSADFSCILYLNKQTQDPLAEARERVCWTPPIHKICLPLYQHQDLPCQWWVVNLHCPFHVAQHTHPLIHGFHPSFQRLVQLQPQPITKNSSVTLLISGNPWSRIRTDMLSFATPETIVGLPLLFKLILGWGDKQVHISEWMVLLMKRFTF